jgi:hypothetical protein
MMHLDSIMLVHGGGAVRAEETTSFKHPESQHDLKVCGGFRSARCLPPDSPSPHRCGRTAPASLHINYTYIFITIILI